MTEAEIFFEAPAPNPLSSASSLRPAPFCLNVFFKTAINISCAGESPALLIPATV